MRANQLPRDKPRLLKAPRKAKRLSAQNRAQQRQYAVALLAPGRKHPRYPDLLPCVGQRVQTAGHLPFATRRTQNARGCRTAPFRRQTRFVSKKMIRPAERRLRPCGCTHNRPALQPASYGRRFFALGFLICKCSKGDVVLRLNASTRLKCTAARPGPCRRRASSSSVRNLFLPGRTAVVVCHCFSGTFVRDFLLGVLLLSVVPGRTAVCDQMAGC